MSRAVGKRAVEKLLVRSGICRARRKTLAPSAVILAYHNVLPKGHPPVGDRSLHLDQVDFAAQLDLLMHTHEVVALHEIFEPRSAGDDRPRAAITFDDAYVGAMTVGIEEVVRRELSATVFVCPGLLGSRGFWWDSLAEGRGGALDPGIRDEGLIRLQGAHAEIVAWASAEGIPTSELPEIAWAADEDLLLSAAASAGIWLGSHSWSHRNLRVLGEAGLSEEMEPTLPWLEENAPRWVRWLAYPYGLHGALAREWSGRFFEGAFGLGGGLAEARGIRRNTNHDLPRINIPRGLSLEGLELRLSGILG